MKKEAINPKANLESLYVNTELSEKNGQLKLYVQV